MKKLTDEQIDAVWIEHGLDECAPNEFARSIETEVLRINGLTAEAAEQREQAVDLDDDHEFWISVCEGLDEAKKSATHGMNLGQRIAHVGGRITEKDAVEFGSVMAVKALISHVLRDISPTPPAGVPDGYALISVDALRAWGRLDEVNAACIYPLSAAPQPAAQTQEVPQPELRGPQ